MRPGEITTRLAVLDLDSHKGETSWQEMLDASALATSALSLFGFTPTVFVSSGGKGIHLYILWEQPQDAYSVREALADALRSVGFEPGTGGVSAKEIEVFPKQSSIAETGYGSMFVLPLSGASEHLTGSFVFSESVAFKQPPQRKEHHGMLEPQLHVLQSALDAIPNSGKDELAYDEWFRVVCAVHSVADDDVGLQLVDQFSSRASKHDPAFLEHRVWPYITHRAGGFTVRSLYSLARKYGWQEPIEDTFDVLPEMPQGEFAASPSQEGGENPTASPAARFPAVHISQFATGKPLAWIIDDVLPQAELAVVYGESGSGKSFLVFDMLAAIALGAPWRERPVMQGDCVYICAEGARGFRVRSQAYAKAKGISLADLPIRVIADTPHFMLVPDVKDVIRSIGRAAVVVVDTLSNVMTGGNENAAEDMGLVVSHCKQIHRFTGALVILIHHSGKDASKGARGSSALRGYTDCEIETVRTGQDRVAIVTKLKDAEDGAEFGFRLGVVECGVDERGKPVSSCVVAHGDVNAKERKTRQPKGVHTRLMWRIAHELGDLADNTIPEKTLIDAVIESMPSSGRHDRRLENANRALLTLIESGYLSLEDKVVTVGGV